MSGYKFEAVSRRLEVRLMRLINEEEVWELTAILRGSVQRRKEGTKEGRNGGKVSSKGVTGCVMNF